MNIRTIRDLLVDAVHLDREAHEHVGPAPLRAQNLAYAHDFIDMVGWGKVPGDKSCQLEKADADPYQALRREFWEQYSREPTPAEIAKASAVLDWTFLVDKQEDRRALMGWLNSKAGGKAFRRWCLAVEGISQKTGLKRKDRALAQIQRALAGSGALHDDFGILEGLPLQPGIDDLMATIATGADDSDSLNSWAASGAKPAIDIEYESDRSGDRTIAVPASDFSWAAKQNARRRQREAARKKKEAA